jgi:hypothetical protein
MAVPVPASTLTVPRLDRPATAARPELALEPPQIPGTHVLAAWLGSCCAPVRPSSMPAGW